MTDITWDKIFAVGFESGWRNAVVFWKQSNDNLLRENTIMKEALIKIEAGNSKMADASENEIIAGAALDYLKKDI